MYCRNCYLRPSLGAAKASLKQQVVCETRVAKTCLCKVNFFSCPIQSGSHFPIFQQSQRSCSCSKLTQKYVYSSVVLYSRWIALCMQNLVVAGHVRQVVAHHRDFSVQKHAWNFGHKDQVVFGHRDCKLQFYCSYHSDWMIRETLYDKLWAYSASILSWPFITNSSVEFSVCEMHNFSPAWHQKHGVMWISMLSQVLTKAAGRARMQKMQKVRHLKCRGFSVFSTFPCFNDFEF